MGCDEDWHEDILTGILIRLPIKSMIRFRCVARTWQSLIENPRFVSRHLSISKKNRRLLVYHYHKEANRQLLRFFHDQSLVSFQDFGLLPQKANKLNYPLSQFAYFWVNDGLCCASDISASSIMVYNPLTREFRGVPRPPFSGTLLHLGSGWDSSSNDYKVICLWSKGGARLLNSCSLGPYLCSIYRLSSDSWKMLKWNEDEVGEDLYIFTKGSCCVNGVHYWAAFNASAYKVLELHLGNENFRFIDWPPTDECSFASFQRMFRLPHDEYRVSFWTKKYHYISGFTNNVWGLNHDGRSWNKLLHLENSSGIFGIGFWNDLNEVLVESMDGKLWLHDIETEEFTDLRTNFNECVKRTYFTYEESCAPLSRR